MRLRIAALAGVAALAGIATTAVPASAAVQAGLLKCRVAPSVGYVIGSQRDMRCWFTPSGGGRAQVYEGRAGRLGLDVGYTGEGVLMWNVLAPTKRVGRGDLAGNYAGASAGAAVGAGVGANALVGGSNNTVALQPLSGEANRNSLNVALGVTTLQLR